MRRSIRLLTLAALIAFASCLFAQPQTGQPIERQMTPEQFKAAGLDKLDADELAQLNAWLNRTLETETAKAAVEAKQKVVDDARGFLSFGSSEPIVGRIAGEFRGFARGRSYTLENGHVWQQIDGASLAGVRKNGPKVTITPSIVGTAWYMAVDGYNARAKVQRVK